tara:strand:- start:255 stop:656 length:402 start_codon:yes stop_codon:yes gene_type:complete
MQKLDQQQYEYLKSRTPSQRVQIYLNRSVKVSPDETSTVLRKLSPKNRETLQRRAVLLNRQTIQKLKKRGNIEVVRHQSTQTTPKTSEIETQTETTPKTMEIETQTETQDYIYWKLLLVAGVISAVLVRKLKI